uniref:Uncharacterized protein n=1 Tax=Euplotes harpa TaxID=151035 RepID=A0A7S3NEA3_9SPIT|mmetsp:Transcript_42125/g.48889  ORF Transcript_42125/g.48889 Transcript_42125/m.48889 type:complete len:165 (+) Transcript_42125:474-968(+)
MASQPVETGENVTRSVNCKLYGIPPPKHVKRIVHRKKGFFKKKHEKHFHKPKVRKEHESLEFGSQTNEKVLATHNEAIFCIQEKEDSCSSTFKDNMTINAKNTSDRIMENFSFRVAKKRMNGSIGNRRKNLHGLSVSNSRNTNKIMELCDEFDEIVNEDEESKL